MIGRSSEPRRRLTVAEHEAFRREMFPPPHTLPDPDDDLVGDPMVERHGNANRRKESQAARVLGILDELAREERRAS
jgi:hypothetical protein